jgi:hypothetical protein
MQTLCGLIVAALAVGNVLLLVLYFQERRLRIKAEAGSYRPITIGEAVGKRRRRGQ